MQKVSDLSRKGNCQTCRFWQPFEKNSMAGVCPLLGALFWEKENGVEVSVVIAHPMSLTPPVSDALRVRTGQYFGCIRFEPKDSKSVETKEPAALLSKAGETLAVYRRSILPGLREYHR